MIFRWAAEARAYASGPPGTSLAWYDYTDTATLFQATGLVTPTTTNGQVVKSVTDLSGNGKHQENASGTGTRVAAGFSVTAGANGGLLCPSLSHTSGHTVFVIADGATPSSGLLVDSRDSVINYFYRAAPYGYADGNSLGDAAFYTGLAGHRCYGLRVGTGINPSIWRAGTSYAAAGSPSGTITPTSRIWSLGMYSLTPFNDPCVTTYKGLIIYDGALSDGDMAAVSTWAATRWGL